METLLRELKPDIETRCGPLFDFAQSQIRKRGAYLPFGATLGEAGQVVLAGAGPEGDPASTSHVLTLLHRGLRETVGREGALAVAVCEWVRITPTGERETDAIKVLIEHRRGLVVALDLPAHKTLLRRWKFGEIVARPAQAEVCPWG